MQRRRLRAAVTEKPVRRVRRYKCQATITLQSMDAGVAQPVLEYRCGRNLAHYGRHLLYFPEREQWLTWRKGVDDALFVDSTDSAEQDEEVSNT